MDEIDEIFHTYVHEGIHLKYLEMNLVAADIGGAGEGLGVMGREQ